MGTFTSLAEKRILPGRSGAPTVSGRRSRGKGPDRARDFLGMRTMDRQALADQSSDRDRLLSALNALRKGDFGIRVPRDRNGTNALITDAFNGVAELNELM